MTAPTIKRNTAKMTLDQRAPSRHVNALIAYPIKILPRFETKALERRAVAFIDKATLSESLSWRTLCRPATLLPTKIFVD
jgi:hypothetical protein